MTTKIERMKGVFWSILAHITKVRLCYMPSLQVALSGQSIITNSPNKVFYLVGHMHLPNPFPVASMINLIGRAYDQLRPRQPTTCKHY